MKTYKKVLHLRSSGGLLGAENVIIELCRYSRMFGYEPVVAAVCDRGMPAPDFLSFLPESTSHVAFECNGKLDLKMIKKVEDFVAGNQIDIIHCHGYKEDFYTFFAAKGCTKVATNHLWKKTDIKGAFYACLDALLLRFFDGVVAVSDEIQQDMHKKGIRKNVIKISNGIEVSKFRNKMDVSALREQLGLKEQETVIGMISSLTPEKGHQTALSSIQKLVSEGLDNIRLVIVGDGPSADRITTLIKELALDGYVVMPGRQTNVPEYLSLFNIFLISSYREGLPMALLEAMASGKAVIASRVGEIPNVIEDGVSGFLVEPKNVSMLSQVLKKLVGSPEAILEMGKKAQTTIDNHYTSILMVEQYCDLYDRLLLKKKIQM